MSYIIHCRCINGVLVYRIWSTASDTYTTDVITADQARDFITEDTIARARETAASRAASGLERASVSGTSSAPLRTPLDSPWDVEKCKVGPVAHFHHQFESRHRSLSCAECGEPQQHVAHKKPCKP